MTKRRESIVRGARAASIAALAIAHGAAAADPATGEGCGIGFGDSEGGVRAGFSRASDAVSAFIKFEHATAEVFLKEVFHKGAPLVEAFLKLDNKEVQSFFLKLVKDVDGNEVFFHKMNVDGTLFEVQDSAGNAARALVSNGKGGLQVIIEEAPADGAPEEPTPGGSDPIVTLEQVVTTLFGRK